MDKEEVYIHKRYIYTQPLKKNEIMPFAAIWMEQGIITLSVQKEKDEGDREDGRGVIRGDHQLPSKYIKNSSRYGTTPTKQPLGDSRGPQASRGTS